MKDLTTTTPSQKEAETVAWADDAIDSTQWSQYKQAFERQWMVNILQYQGVTNVRWDGVAQQFKKDGRSDYVSNRIAQKVDGIVALMTSAMPEFSAKPGSARHEDRVAARVATRLCEDYYRSTLAKEKEERLVLWSALTGAGFLYNTGKEDNQTKRRLYKDPMTGAYVPADALSEYERIALEQEGDFLDVSDIEPDIEVLSPYAVNFDPEATTIDEARFMVHVEEVSIDYVFERFGVIVGPDSLPPQMVSYRERLATFYGTIGAGLTWNSRSLLGDTSTNTERETTVLKEVVFKPYVQKQRNGKWKEYPKGRYVVVAGGRVMYDGDNPFWEAGFKNGFPVSMFGWRPMPGRFWPKSYVEDLIAPARAYNETRRAAIESFRTMGMPKWVTAKGSQLRKGQFDDRSGEVLTYNPHAGPAPAPVLPRSIDGNAVNHLIMAAQADLEDASGIHDLLSAKVPSNMRSGPAMELAMESDVTDLTPKMRRLKGCIENALTNLVRAAGTMLGDDAIVQITGARPGDVSTFRASLVRGVRSIEIIPGSFAVRSKAAVQEKILNAIQAGALDPASNRGDREVVMRGLEFNEFHTELTRTERQRDTAELENEAMSAPVPLAKFPSINDFDDDEIHIEVHASFIQSDDFRRLPPAQQSAILGHRMKHVQRRQQAQQAQMEALLVAKGAPGPKGTPSPPKPTKQK